MPSPCSHATTVNPPAMQPKDLPAKKRATFWMTLDSGAELDPLALDVPKAKRLRAEESSDSTAAVAPMENTIFGMPTGRLEETFELRGSVLGSGQYGTVRECRDRVTGETLACKTIRKTSDELQHEDVRNEVELMTRLVGCENVVQLRGAFEDEENVHLVMDMCEGGELFDEIVRRHEGRPAPFSEEEAAHLFAEIVKGVAFCHARGVMHRDLKPENILMTRRLQDGESILDAIAKGPLLKVADFGLSTAVTTGQKIKGSAGSPFYMAPEVLTGEYNCKGDVWSLGVILYILLCGSPPFWGETDSGTFRATLEGKPNMSATPWNSISAEAKGLVKALLVQDPARRPSAQKLLTHPWLVGHISGGRSLRRAALSAVPRLSLSVS